MMLNKFTEKDFCFFQMMGYYFSRKEIIKELGQQIYSNNKMIWYIAYENINEIIGFASLENKDKYYYLDNVYINKNYRGKGFAKKIILKIVKENFDKDIKLITDNKVAKKIYKDNGFIEDGKRGRYEKMILKKRIDIDD